MSKTRTNRPNNTASKIAPRMVHVSAQISWIGKEAVLLTRKYFRHGGAAMRGNTLNLGRNAAKRSERARRAASLKASA